jgi:hypothetical protein
MDAMATPENLSHEGRDVGAGARTRRGRAGTDEGGQGIANQEIAATLERVADLLEAQDANPLRVRAYRRGADAVRALDQPVAALLAAPAPHGAEPADEPDERAAGIQGLPGIGAGLAAAIREIVQTGRLRLLDRLEGEAAHGDLFTTVPGIGAELAHRIHDTLGIETLEDLESAAHDGRLERVPGFGARRVQSVCAYLDAALSRTTRQRAAARQPGQLRFGFAQPAAEPPVALLLGLDETYRRLAEADRLPRIAPRRFNPEKHAWLPVWHTERAGWSFSALYSNTARAHELGKVRDWVVIFYERDGREEQCTVVTEHQGPLAGRRVIRGREAACARHYEDEAVPDDVRAWAHELAESA